MRPIDSSVEKLVRQRLVRLGFQRGAGNMLGYSLSEWASYRRETRKGQMKFAFFAAKPWAHPVFRRSAAP